MRHAYVGVWLLAATAGAQTVARAYSYSNMKYLADQDDIAGWDISIATAREGYSGVLYCGRTDVQGPVRFHLNAINGRQIVQPENTVCGATLTLDFRAGALFVQANQGATERVPRHTNFLSEEKFR